MREQKINKFPTKPGGSISVSVSEYIRPLLIGTKLLAFVFDVQRNFSRKLMTMSFAKEIRSCKK